MLPHGVEMGECVCDLLLIPLHSSATQSTLSRSAARTGRGDMLTATREVSLGVVGVVVHCFFLVVVVVGGMEQGSQHCCICTKMATPNAWCHMLPIARRCVHVQMNSLNKRAAQLLEQQEELERQAEERWKQVCERACARVHAVSLFMTDRFGCLMPSRHCSIQWATCGTWISTSATPHTVCRFKQPGRPRGCWRPHGWGR